jgi:hypothetical protein
MPSPFDEPVKTTATRRRTSGGVHTSGTPRETALKLGDAPDENPRLCPGLEELCPVS